MAIFPADDYLHEPSPSPYWNEVGWFSFMAPERDLCGFLYMYHRPNAGYTVAGVAVWDPAGTETYDCLLYDWGEAYKISPDTEMFDFSVDNGLSVAVIEPLRQFHFTYHGQTAYNGDVSLDLVFTSDQEPYAGDLASEGMQEWGAGHFDQFGRMSGHLVIDGEKITIDCAAQRDRSWGVRNIVNNPRGEFVWGVGEHSSFQVLAVNTLPPAADPGVGTTEDVVFGYYVRDGQYGALTKGTGGKIEVTQRDTRGRPVTLRIDATDSLGRHLEATGRVRSLLNWQGYSWLTIFWCLVEWDFDGQKAFGELQDYWPLHHARSFLRGQYALTNHS
ncbi:DUF7065 domain-containing protein [Nocardia sp. NPDC004123]